MRRWSRSRQRAEAVGCCQPHHSVLLRTPRRSHTNWHLARVFLKCTHGPTRPQPTPGETMRPIASALAATLALAAFAANAQAVRTERNLSLMLVHQMAIAAVN